MRFFRMLKLLDFSELKCLVHFCVHILDVREHANRNSFNVVYGLIHIRNSLKSFFHVFCTLLLVLPSFTELCFSSLFYNKLIIILLGKSFFVLFTAFLFWSVGRPCDITGLQGSCREFSTHSHQVALCLQPA